eukprot:1135728-Rhodomonas_salina.4
MKLSAAECSAFSRFIPGSDASTTSVPGTPRHATAVLDFRVVALYATAVPGRAYTHRAWGAHLRHGLCQYWTTRSMVGKMLRRMSVPGIA